MTVFKAPVYWRVAATVLLATWCVGSAAAPAVVPERAMPPAVQVPMQATVQSTFQEDGGARLYVRLRLRLAVHLPFTTLTYRMPDRAVWMALRERSQVEFSASRIAGENTVTAIRALPS